MAIHLLGRSVVLLALCLSACGGSGDDASDQPQSVSAVTIEPQTDRLSVHWGAAEGATFYRVSWQDFAGAPFAVLADQVLTTAFETPFSTLPAAASAPSIRVDACNRDTCTPGAIRTVTWPPVPATGVYVKASNPAMGALFGRVLALSADGSTMAVGAPGENGANVSNSGAVYVYVRRSGVWSQQAHLQAADPGINDAFGSAVALSADGRTLVASASHKHGPATQTGSDPSQLPERSRGAVYVFQQSGGQWLLEASLPTSTESFVFGRALALSGNGRELVAADQGRTRVFSKMSGWQEEASLPGGDALAISANGTTLAVGSIFESVSGTVHVYARGAQDWVPKATLTASPSVANPTIYPQYDRFGHAVTLSATGDVIAVGAPGDGRALYGEYADVPAGGGSMWSEQHGAVHVFVRRSGTWQQEAYLKPVSGNDFSALGAAVALSADGRTLAVGAPFNSWGGAGVLPLPLQVTSLAAWSGMVQVYKRTGTQWAVTKLVKGTNADAFDEFGGAVGLSADGSQLAVGADSEGGLSAGVGGAQTQLPNQHYVGAVYVY
jgi:hypothetical protein